MSATHAKKFTTTAVPVLYLAFELSWGSWELFFTVGAAQPPRKRGVKARDTLAVAHEIERAKRRFGLPQDAKVISCYEAGRDGFWLHRWLTEVGVENLVVDSASIEVNRRKRRAKSDHLDGTKLVSMLIRWHTGEKKVWSVVHVPSAGAEDGRQLHRELIQLKCERTEHTNRIKGLFASVGLKVAINDQLPTRLDKLRLWDGSRVPPALRERILREFERLQLVQAQIRALEAERARQIREERSPQGDQTRRLMTLKGIGANGAWVLVREFFGWRQIRHRRELASLAGLTPTPYNSGESRHEQGISKAGNRIVRWMMIQLAWGWLRYQPSSKLSRWFQRRFGKGNSRARKVGIVALARKLLIALWKFLETGEVPAGASMRKKPAVRVQKGS